MATASSCRERSLACLKMRSYATGGRLLDALTCSIRVRNVFAMRTASLQLPRRSSVLKRSSSSALLREESSSSGSSVYSPMICSACLRPMTGRSRPSLATGKLMRMGWRPPTGMSMYVACGSSSMASTLQTPCPG